MSLSADSIGFYLQLDDAQFTKKLASAEGKYASFVSSMEKWNKQVYTGASKGFAALSNLVSSFEQLPDTASKAYTKALSKLRTRMKPLTQKVRFDFTGGTDKQIASAVKRGISSVLRNATIRLSASRPIKKNAIFDTTQSLLSSYAETTQPPDYKGRIQGIPKFAKGGEVGGNKGDIDSVLAFLSPGEIVLPVDVATQLKKLSSRKTLPKGLSEAVTNIENLAKGLEAVHEAAASGLDPKAVKIYGKGLAALESETERLQETTTKLSSKALRKMLPQLGKANKALDKFKDTGEEAQGVFKKLLTKIIGPAQFLAINKAVGDVSGALSRMYSTSSSAFNEAGGEKIGTYIDNLNGMNQQWGLTRDKLRDVKAAGVAMAKSIAYAGVSLTDVGESMQSLAELKFNSVDTLKYSKAVALLNAATGLAGDSGAQLVKDFAQTGSLSEKTVNSLLASMAKYSQLGKATISDLQSQTTANVATMGKSWYGLGEAQKVGMIEGLNQVSAVLPAGFQGIGDTMRDLMAQAASGSIEGQGIAAKLFGGMDSKQIQAALATQGGAAKLLGMAAKNFDNMDDISFTAMAEAYNIDASVAKDLSGLNSQMGDINAKQLELTAATVKAGSGLMTLGGIASNMRTMWDKVSASIVSTVGSMSLFGVSGVDAMDFLTEFNPAVITSVYHLGMMGKELFNGVKGLKMFKRFSKGGLLAGLSGGGKDIKGFFSGVSKGLSKFTSGTGDALSSVSGLLPKMKKGLTSLGGTMLTLGSKGGKGIASLGKSLIGLLPGFAAVDVASITTGGTMYTALAPVILPILAVVAAVAALAAIFYYLNKKFDLVGKAATFFVGIWEGLKMSLWETWTDVIKPAFQPMVDAFTSLWGAVKSVVGAFGLFSIAGDAGTSVMAKLASAGAFVGGLIGDVFGLVLKVALLPTKILGTLFKWIMQIATGMFDFKGIAESLATFFSGGFKTAISGISNLFTTLGDGVRYVWDKVVGLFDKITSFAKNKVFSFFFGSDVEEPVVPEIPKLKQSTLPVSPAELIQVVKVQIQGAGEQAHKDMLLIHELLGRLIAAEGGGGVPNTAAASAAPRNRSSFASDMVRDIAGGVGAGA